MPLSIYRKCTVNCCTPLSCSIVVFDIYVNFLFFLTKPSHCFCGIKSFSLRCSSSYMGKLCSGYQWLGGTKFPSMMLLLMEIQIRLMTLISIHRGAHIPIKAREDMKHPIPTSQTKVILIHECFIRIEQQENSQMLLTCLHFPLVMNNQHLYFQQALLPILIRHHFVQINVQRFCVLKLLICFLLLMKMLQICCFNQLSWRKLASQWNRQVFWVLWCCRGLGLDKSWIKC
jgi:hypothetical protein